MENTLLIDSNGLCYAAYYSMNQLEYDGEGTGIIYGFLSQILTLAEIFKTNHFIFCWDSRKSIRKKVYPEYKAQRKNKSEEELQKLAIAYQQFEALRKEVLPPIGFQCLMQTGYEADDLLAKIVQERIGSFIIVSGDEDLYQCLYNCKIYQPKKKKIMTAERFLDEYNIRIDCWSVVKEIAGCTSDNVSGVPRVGEKTAIKYLKGELSTKSIAFQNIQKNGHIIERNQRLVTLPYPGLKEIEIHFPNLSEDHFLAVCSEYGFESFLEDKRWEKFFQGRFDNVKRRRRRK